MIESLIVISRKRYQIREFVVSFHPSAQPVPPSGARPAGGRGKGDKEKTTDAPEQRKEPRANQAAVDSFAAVSGAANAPGALFLSMADARDVLSRARAACWVV